MKIHYLRLPLQEVRGWQINSILSQLRVASVDVDGTTQTSIYLEYESTVINSILSMNGPV